MTVLQKQMISGVKIKSQALGGLFKHDVGDDGLQRGVARSLCLRRVLEDIQDGEDLLLKGDGVERTGGGFGLGLRGLGL